jgi:transcription elongation GreA/GreB family factor
MHSLKQKIHAYYLQQIDDKLDAFKDMVAALTEGAANDAKGSAGDKHETALSMMHLEQEKLNHKIAEFLEQKAVLEKINPEAASVKIALGSLVQTNTMHLFVSAALPKITIDGITVIALSPQSPLGVKLLGKMAGDVVEVNTTKYTVSGVY